MYVPFNQLSAQSKVWIYASQTPLSENIISDISSVLKEFTHTWQAHGVELKASYEIMYGHFIVIGVDELYHAPSGCSIDKSIQIIKNIESQFDLKLMDRMVVYVLDKEQIKTFPISKVSEAVQQGLIKPESQMYDNTIDSLELYKKTWLKEAQHTWLSRYFVSA